MWRGGEKEKKSIKKRKSSSLTTRHLWLTTIIQNKLFFFSRTMYTRTHNKEGVNGRREGGGANTTKDDRSTEISYSKGGGERKQPTSGNYMADSGKPDTRIYPITCQPHTSPDCCGVCVCVCVSSVCPS